MRFITQAYGAAKLAIRAKAPTIMVVGGVTSMGVGTVLACKQTLKIEEVLAPHAEMLEKIQRGSDFKLQGYSEEDAKSDKIKVYTRVGLEMVKLYAVPGVLFFSGCGLVFGGHRIMMKRNATLALAFTGLKKTFDAYRARVVDAFGEEADQAMYGGSLTKNNGTEKNPDWENRRDWDSASLDPYNRVFEQGASESWENDLSVNRMFVGQQQKFAQQLLNRRGHLYLSEVYTALGFPESDISRVVGWKVKRNPDGSKEYPFVDFGLDKPMPDDWKYSQEKAIYLDFNCQGLIVGGKIQKILEKA